jgi:hypothetical protein
LSPPLQENIDCYEVKGREGQASPDRFLPQAQNGDVRAEYYVGHAYYRGSDYKKAAFWLKKSANQGNADAQGTLSPLYLNDKSGETDYKEAYFWSLLSLKWYKKSDFGKGLDMPSCEYDLLRVKAGNKLTLGQRLKIVMRAEIWEPKPEVNHN